MTRRRRFTAKGLALMDPAELQGLIEKVAARVDAQTRASKCSECGAWGVQALGLCGKHYKRELRLRQRIKRKVCQQCGKLFQSTRQDAFLCSGACRKRRLRAGIRDAVPAIGPALEQIPATEGQMPQGLGSPDCRNLPSPLTWNGSPVVEPPRMTPQQERSLYMAMEGYSAEVIAAGSVARYFAKRAPRPQQARRWGW